MNGLTVASISPEDILAQVTKTSTGDPSPSSCHTLSPCFFPYKNVLSCTHLPLLIRTGSVSAILPPVADLHALLLRSSRGGLSIGRPLRGLRLFVCFWYTCFVVNVERSSPQPARDQAASA